MSAPHFYWQIFKQPTQYLTIIKLYKNIFSLPTYPNYTYKHARKYIRKTTLKQQASKQITNLILLYLHQ